MPAPPRQTFMTPAPNFLFIIQPSHSVPEKWYILCTMLHVHSVHTCAIGYLITMVIISEIRPTGSRCCRRNDSFKIKNDNPESVQHMFHFSRDWSASYWNYRHKSVTTWNRTWLASLIQTCLHAPVDPPGVKSLLTEVGIIESHCFIGG